MVGIPELSERVSGTLTQYSSSINGKLVLNNGSSDHSDSVVDPAKFINGGRDKLIDFSARMSRPIAASKLIQRKPRVSYRYLSIVATVLSRKVYGAFAPETAASTVFLLLKILDFKTPEVGQPERAFLSELQQLVGDLSAANDAKERASIRTQIVDFLDDNCSL